MTYLDLETLLVDYRDILVYMDFFEDYTDKTILKKKKEIIEKFSDFLNLQDIDNEEFVIDKVEDYLMDFV